MCETVYNTSGNQVIALCEVTGLFGQYGEN
jgi:hypothetical protein